MLIGLCGRSGSGKGYVSALFAQKGIPSIDTDKVYRDMTGPCETLSPCMQALTERFGQDILAPDNSLNRGAMRKLVFAGGDMAREASCKQNLTDLNRITHRHILAKTEELAAVLLAEGAPFVLIDAPVLYESGFDTHCAAVVCITASEEVRIGRIMKRDSIPREAAVTRLQAQLDDSLLVQKADYVIENNGDETALRQSVDAVIEKLRERTT